MEIKSKKKKLQRSNSGVKKKVKTIIELQNQQVSALCDSISHSVLKLLITKSMTMTTINSLKPVCFFMLWNLLVLICSLILVTNRQKSSYFFQSQKWLKIFFFKLYFFFFQDGFFLFFFFQMNIFRRNLLKYTCEKLTMSKISLLYIFYLSLSHSIRYCFHRGIDTCPCITSSSSQSRHGNVRFK